MDNKRSLYRIVRSIAALLAAFAVLQLLLWVFVSAGKYFSGFQGTIFWEPFALYAVAAKWTRQQVVFLYLIPYLAFFLLWLMMRTKRKVTTDKPLFFHLFMAWLFSLLLVKVFFFPFWQIINKNGIYYSLSWLGLTKAQQTGLAAVLLVMFILHVVDISQFFGSALDNRGKTFFRPAEIRRQLFFLWLVPFVMFTLLIFCCAGTRLQSAFYWTGGIAITLTINLSVIYRYKVIVR